MISGWFLWGNVLPRGELQKDAINSNFENFESALYMKSLSVPLNSRIQSSPCTLLENVVSYLHDNFFLRMTEKDKNKSNCSWVLYYSWYNSVRKHLLWTVPIHAILFNTRLKHIKIQILCNIRHFKTYKIHRLRVHYTPHAAAN